MKKEEYAKIRPNHLISFGNYVINNDNILIFVKQDEDREKHLYWFRVEGYSEDDLIGLFPSDFYSID